MIPPTSLSAAPFPDALAEPAAAGVAAAAARLASAAPSRLPGLFEAATGPSPLARLGAAASADGALSTLRRTPARRAAAAGYASAGATGTWTAAEAARATNVAKASKATTLPKTAVAAKVATTAKATTAKATTTKKTAAPAGFAFLSDPRLSVEEKLFRFMCAMAQKYDDALEAKMKEMAGGSTSPASTNKAGGTTASAPKPKAKKSGLLGKLGTFLKVAVPGAGATLELLKMKEVQGLLKTVSGPVLAAGATALGFPQLAPLLLKAGPDIANVAVGLANSLDDGPATGGSGASALGGASSGASSSGSSSSSSTSSSTTSGASEQVQMLELQRLQEKQREMFSMVTNVLRSMHETKMAMINNLRA